MKEINAWCFDVGGGRIAAIGVGHLRHLVAKPGLFEISKTPAGCGRVFVWDDAIIPVLDFDKTFGAEAEIRDAPAQQLSRSPETMVI